MSFGISYFELDAFWQDGKRLKNISNPDCLCLWGHEILRNRACNLFFQKGLGLGLSLNRSFTKVKSITEIEKRLRKILLTEITLTTDKIVAQNILISSFLEHGYKIFASEQLFMNPDYDDIFLKDKSDIKFLTSSHAKELINSGDHKTARRVVFLTDGTKLCEQILKTIDSGYLKHATVVIDTTWTLLDYLLFKTFRQDLSYIFDLTLLGLRNTCCIVNDHLNVSFPHTSEVLAELSYELILFAKNTPSKPRPFHLKSILEEAHPFQDSNKFFVFSENSNWTSAILFKNQKHFIDFHRILYRRGFGMIPSSVRLLQKGQVIGFYFNNKASHELSKDLDTCMKLRKTIFDTV